MTESKSAKFVTTLVLVLKMIESEDKAKYDKAFKLKAEIVINKSDIDDVFQPIYTAIISNIKKSLGKGSGWIIDSVIDHTISVLKYNPLVGSSYIKLTKELDHPRKGLLNVQNTDDNECIKWCLVRYLNPANHNPKADKDFTKGLDFKDMKFRAKIRDTHKIEKNNSIGISVFSCSSKEKYPIYVSKQCCEEKHW